MTASLFAMTQGIQIGCVVLECGAKEAALWCQWLKYSETKNYVSAQNKKALCMPLMLEMEPASFLIFSASEERYGKRKQPCVIIDF